MPLHVIILAAGQGKRMMSDLPKVAHVAAGRSLVGWVLQAVSSLSPASTVVVVGHGGHLVEPLLPEGTITAVQEAQLGTGHAAKIGLAALGKLPEDDTVMILYGDMPLLGEDLLRKLSARHSDTAVRLVTASFADPGGYGRIIRDATDAVVGIVEEADCTEEQAGIREINAGAYAFSAGALDEVISSISANNVQGELYLTDAIGILVDNGRRVEAVAAAPEEVVGINSQDQLAEATRLLHRRTAQRLMDSGVWILDPERTYIDDTVTIGPGCRIYPGVFLEGATSIGEGVHLGPDVYAVDTEIGSGSRVWYAVVRGAVIGRDCEVGPYASLRPGTVMADRSKAGTFVETKNTVLGEGSKVPHLSYIGDASIGARSNIGAGTITVNYDGIEKHRTEIGEDAFVGSDTMLVAPVRIGDGASTGAGSVITHDVSDGALAIERSDQKEIPGYADRRKARKEARKKAKD